MAKSKTKTLYQFTDASATFHVDSPERVSGLYFPLCNEEGLLSAITPTLHGDIKLDQHTFYSQPVSIDDLHLSLSSRNFWISTDSVHWSVTGQSAWQKVLKPGTETLQMDAGMLWQKLIRRNKKVGLEATILNFVPSEGSTFETMMVEIKNISSKNITLKATSAIPLFGRSADNLRDHRHVTSLLHRLSAAPFGLTLCPTMSFNERGHHPNQVVYYLFGLDEDGHAPAGFFPTLASFIGEGGTLDRPSAVFDRLAPQTGLRAIDQGHEAMGALQFNSRSLPPGRSTQFILFMGVDPTGKQSFDWVKRLGQPKMVSAMLENTRSFWKKEVSRIEFQTGDETFNRWIKWVQIQPMLRKIFGCSFLPDFDYGRGGRGWRDLWQDCLALLLANPDSVRDMIRGNWAGVRIDGSNATIIGKKTLPQAGGQIPEFIADRNNITRTWMDHGIWPFLTTQLYLHQTGDFELLMEQVTYFRDAQLNRGRRLDRKWDSSPAPENCHLKTKSGAVYKGTILEHILIQNLVQFFNVGEHNMIRLEDADWNDGLDLARNRGESVAFTHFYAANIEALADTLEEIQKRKGWTDVHLADEIMVLLDRVTKCNIDYDDVERKTSVLENYFLSVPGVLGGEITTVPVSSLIHDLREKAAWLRSRLQRQEWVEADGQRWLNGYYDNEGRQVEGASPVGRIHMTLTGQVFAIMGHIADENGVQAITEAVDRYLYDPELQGYRLNTDFGIPQLHLGRAFSFAFGEKENGSVFSHMVIMYANALYARGFVKQGYRALFSLYSMAIQSERSKIFPGIPEYFNNEGRGRYHYLTGSASWFVFTLLTQVFGFRGCFGDLLLAPKLVPDQFDRRGEAQVTAPFAGSTVTVIIKNPHKVVQPDMVIESVTDESGHPIPLGIKTAHEVTIPRTFLRGKKHQTIVLHIA